jgi:hypothetical protein
MSLHGGKPAGNLHADLARSSRGRIPEGDRGMSIMLEANSSRLKICNKESFNTAWLLPSWQAIGRPSWTLLPRNLNMTNLIPP